MIVLGLETSCDETAAGLVMRNGEGEGRILAQRLRSQVEEHSPFGGVVPEIAARAHVGVLDRLIEGALQDAGLQLEDIDAIAATAGPGLLGGLLVGMTTGQVLAEVAAKPFIPVNHLEAHALTPRLTHAISFPYLVLLVSGGHTQILSVEGIGAYRRLATTMDDALGEAFDKVAKLLGLDFPGGPQVETWALRGDAARFPFPRPMKGKTSPHFSFSGLKTAVRQTAQSLEPLKEQDIADLCASFQQAAAESVSDRLDQALRTFTQERGQAKPTLAIAGGVAANRALAAALQSVADRHGARLVVPPAELCTDNGVMIAWAGAERLSAGLIEKDIMSARARWPLDPHAEAVPFAGVKA